MDEGVDKRRRRSVKCRRCKQRFGLEKDYRLTTHGSRLTSVTGAINIIDLANVYSCSFVATDDAGKLYADGSFEVLGRIDDSDVRGCSLMAL